MIKVFKVQLAKITGKRIGWFYFGEMEIPAKLKDEFLNR